MQKIEFDFLTSAEGPNKLAALIRTMWVLINGSMWLEGELREKLKLLKQWTLRIMLLKLNWKKLLKEYAKDREPKLLLLLLMLAVVMTAFLAAFVFAMTCGLQRLLLLTCLGQYIL